MTTMKELREQLKALGVTEERHGNNFTFRVEGYTIKVKQTKMGLYKEEYSIVLNELRWAHTTAEDIKYEFEVITKAKA